MEMNSDASAWLYFVQILDYSSQRVLKIKLEMGEESEINAHASFRFKLKNLQL